MERRMHLPMALPATALLFALQQCFGSMSILSRAFAATKMFPAGLVARSIPNAT
jgi:hypothetical protein